ncbi:MAG: penicillin-binding protein 2, partial [Bacteroidetes bacterium]|nr:penicillin-binding protein 2 [Bacteroidota bacterium]
MDQKVTTMMRRLLLVAAFMLIFGGLISYKLFQIQWVEKEELKHSALYDNRKLEPIEAKRGSIYSVDGALLATSVSSYTVHFDPTVSRGDLFENEIRLLCDSLAQLLNTDAKGLEAKLRRARQEKDRYVRIASNLDYGDYKRLERFPLFVHGRGKGGLIVDSKVTRKKPLDPLASRLVGYYLDEGTRTYRVGLEGGFNDHVLKGEDGLREVQRIQKGLWKPVNLDNTKEPRDGYDLVTTIHSNIQDITHSTLSQVLRQYRAERGLAVVMDVQTGAIRAMSNLNMNPDSTYSETYNAAVADLYEPGSTFKLMSLIAALEDKKVDTATTFHAKYGQYKVYDKYIYDSRKGGYGAINLATAFAVSSNTAFAEMINEGYKGSAQAFVNRLYSMKLHEPLGLPIEGEQAPLIRYPGDKGWSGLSLAWMSHGYELLMTPLQVLAFYNAIANDGRYIKPRFVAEVRRGNQVVRSFDTEVIHPSIASTKTVKIAQRLLADVVEKPYGTAH